MKRMWSRNEIKEIVKVTQGYNFANLVDKDGHSRFIEGELNTTELTGIEYQYAKWSLSGTHLLIVLCFSADVDAYIGNGQTLATIDLPTWIKDKIVSVWGSYIAIQSNPLRADDWTQQTFSLTLLKDSGVIKLNSGTGVTITTNKKYARFQFDLLIDND